jgi:hypothetical protein
LLTWLGNVVTCTDWNRTRSQCREMSHLLTAQVVFLFVIVHSSWHPFWFSSFSSRDELRFLLSTLFVVVPLLLLPVSPRVSLPCSLGPARVSLFEPISQPALRELTYLHDCRPSKQTSCVSGVERSESVGIGTSNYFLCG